MDEIAQSRKDTSCQCGVVPTVLINNILRLHGVRGRTYLQARIRNMMWQALPAASERRQQNTSMYDNSKKRLFWRVEWRFPAIDMVVTNE